MARQRAKRPNLQTEPSDWLVGGFEVVLMECNLATVFPLKPQFM